MSRFNTKPARKPWTSIPYEPISPAPRKTIASTKMNCITLSLYRWKNQRPIRGKTDDKKPRKMTLLPAKPEQPPCLPFNSPPTTARINSVSVSVTAVPPTAILTLRWRYAKACDNRIGYKGMWRVHTGQQYGSDYTVFQVRYICHKSYSYGTIKPVIPVLTLCFVSV